jgi:hypothetical protein
MVKTRILIPHSALEERTAVIGVYSVNTPWYSIDKRIAVANCASAWPEESLYGKYTRAKN